MPLRPFLGTKKRPRTFARAFQLLGRAAAARFLNGFLIFLGVALATGFVRAAALTVFTLKSIKRGG